MSTVDPLRVARATLLTVERLTANLYTVTGGEAPHRVQVGPPEDCDCVDFGVHGGRCKHLLAVALRRGDPAAWRALGKVIRDAKLDRAGRPKAEALKGEQE